MAMPAFSFAPPQPEKYCTCSEHVRIARVGPPSSVHVLVHDPGPLRSPYLSLKCVRRATGRSSGGAEGRVPLARRAIVSSNSSCAS